MLKVLAVSLPTLSWKCCMPLGNKITSPTCSVAAYSTLSSLMKPVYTVPLSTKSVSAARGWVCSGNTPPTAKSRRAWVMPCVLMPGHSSGTTTIAPDPVGDCAISAGDATATATVVAQLLQVIIVFADSHPIFTPFSSTNGPTRICRSKDSEPSAGCVIRTISLKRFYSSGQIKHSPAERKPVKTKSWAVTSLRGLQAYPFTRGALADRSATQKSWRGSGSAA